MDFDKITNGGQFIESQRLLSIEDRLGEEVGNNNRAGYEYEQAILTEKEERFLPAAKIIVGLLFAEAEATYQHRKTRGPVRIPAPVRYEKTGRI